MRPDEKVTLWLAITAIFLLLAVLFLGLATKAECAWCPQMRCFGGDCPGDCECLIAPGELSGGCYSLRTLPAAAGEDERQHSQD